MPTSKDYKETQEKKNGLIGWGEEITETIYFPF